MAGVILTSRGYCLDATCGWACEGEPAVVEKSTVRHGKTSGHSTATWTHSAEATPDSGTDG